MIGEADWRDATQAHADQRTHADGHARGERRDPEPDRDEVEEEDDEDEGGEAHDEDPAELFEHGEQTFGLMSVGGRGG